MNSTINCLITCLIAMFLIGCGSVPTYNYATSKSVFKVINGEQPLGSAYGMLIFITDENKRYVTFSLKKDGANKEYTSKIDKGSFAAFCVLPGTYIFQNNMRIFISDRDRACFIISPSHAPKRIAKDALPRMLYLSKSMTGDHVNFFPAQEKIPDYVSGEEKFGYYAAATVVYTLAAPFYVVKYTSFMLAYMAMGAMHSGSPAAMIGGALVYCLTFWALDESDRQKAGFSQSSGTATKTSISDDDVMLNSGIQENAYGPGIHQDQYGRPVQYHVPNWPANEPTQFLEVKPDAYGPGVGMDQFGRPVTTRPAF